MPVERLSTMGRIAHELSVVAGVDATSPPAFPFHAEDGPVIPPAGTIAVHAAYRAAGVPAELRLYKTDGHGFGIRDARGPVVDRPRGGDPAARTRLHRPLPAQ